MKIYAKGEIKNYLALFDNVVLLTDVFLAKESLDFLKNINKHFPDLKNSKKFVWHDIEEFENAHIDTEGYLSFDPDFDIEEAANEEKYYMFSVDIAEGNGGDYSVINMFEVEPLPDKDIENYINPGAMYDFFRLNQMAHIRFGINLVNIRRTSRIKRRKIFFPFLIFDINRTFPRKQHSVSGVS